MRTKKIFLNIFLKYSVLALVIGAAVVWYFRSGKAQEEVMVAHPGDFVQQVSVSGKVAATESLGLSFEQGGRVTAVAVKAGDMVAAGQVLASQDTTELNAQLAEMQAGIDVQKAKLEQLLAGASPEDVAVAETAVTNARTSLASARTGLDNARQNMADTLKDAYTKADDAVLNKADQMFNNPQTNTPHLAFAAADSQLQTHIDSGRFQAGSILKKWKALLDEFSPTGDFIAVIEDTKSNLDQIKSFLDLLSLAVNNPNSCVTTSQQSCQPLSSAWKSDISTARANINTALAAVTAAEGKIKTAESDVAGAEGSLRTSQDQLTLKKAPARSADIALNHAQIRQAEASRQNIASQLAKKQVRSPINGVVTAVNVKTGSIAVTSATAISLISSDPLQIESYVPEINIPLIHAGNQAAVTLDAYGKGRSFNAQVIAIDPAETVRDGVSTYKVTLQFTDHGPGIKSGMTANILITTEKKNNVIAVPQGIVVMKDGAKFVRVKEGDSVVERKVETGSVSALGRIEITSGLKDGDIVLLE